MKQKGLSQPNNTKSVLSIIKSAQLGAAHYLFSFCKPNLYLFPCNFTVFLAFPREKNTNPKPICVVFSVLCAALFPGLIHLCQLTLSPFSSSGEHLTAAQWTHVPVTITTRNNPSEISQAPKWDLRYLYDNTGSFWEFSFVNLHLLLFWKLVICPCLRGKTKTMPKNHVLFHCGIEVPQRAETRPRADQNHSFWISFRDTPTLHPAHPDWHKTLPLTSRICQGAAGTLLLLRPAAGKQKQKKVDGK